MWSVVSPFLRFIVGPLLLPGSLAPGAPHPDSIPPWMVVDRASRTVTLTLEVQAGSDGGPATIAGHHHGNAQVVLLLNWTLRWRWLNADSGSVHSLVVMTEREKLPTEGGRPAFDNAMSRSVTAGLQPGQTDETMFVADQAGWYWLLCGVPGHALGGEWIGIKVDREAKTPGVTIKQ